MGKLCSILCKERTAGVGPIFFQSNKYNQRQWTGEYPMKKASLVGLLFEDSSKTSRKAGASGSNQKGCKDVYDLLNSTTRAPQKSSKMIKITQFNSQMIMQDDKVMQKDYSINGSNCLQRNFHIKRIGELKNKAAANAQKAIEMEVKCREKSIKSRMNLSQFCEQSRITPSIDKILVTTRCNFRSQYPNIDLFDSADYNPEIIHTCDEKEKFINEQMHEQKIVQSKEMMGLTNDTLRNSPSPQKSKKRLNIDSIWLKGDEKSMAARRLSASPKKYYSKPLYDHKKYQENIEQERKELLEMKKQLNKNYAKPFNPPENISAFGYIIFEADAKKHKYLRKVSFKPDSTENGTQIRKILLHSHKVIASNNIRTSVEIASLTKIMTCILAIDIANRFNLIPQEEFITVGLFEQNIGGTSANIRKGQIYSLWQMLHGLMLPSGNDASLAIAVWGGKHLLEQETKKDLSCSVNCYDMEKPGPKKKDCYDRFILEMNNKAIQLNMEKTKYSNSHGLSDPFNRSCPYDLGILCEHAMNNKLFRQIVSCRSFQGQIKIESQQSMTTLRQSARFSHQTSSKKLSFLSNMEMSEQLNLEDEQMKNMQDVREMMYDEEQEETHIQSDKIMLTKTIRWDNTHQLLQQKPQLYVGIKTGITNTAGPCLASCIQFKGRRWIIVVLNCKSMKFRFRDTQNLRRWLFQREGIKYKEKPIEPISADTGEEVTSQEQGLQQ